MAKKFIEVCKLCNLESCDGNLYKYSYAESPTSPHSPIITFVTCSSDPDLRKSGDKFIYRFSVGYGVDFDLPVEPYFGKIKRYYCKWVPDLGG